MVLEGTEIMVPFSFFHSLPWASYVSTKAETKVSAFAKFFISIMGLMVLIIFFGGGVK